MSITRRIDPDKKSSYKSERCSFSKWIASLRRKNGLSQGMVAKFLHVNKQYYIQFEHRVRTFDDTQLNKLSKILGIAVGTLRNKISASKPLRHNRPKKQCLNCDKDFHSDSPFLRLCPYCRREAAGDTTEFYGGPAL